jgi:hypothetical protein
MTQLVSLNRRKNLNIKLFLFISLILCASALNAQSPVNFSGEWTQDNVKSDDYYKEFNAKFIIIQTPQSITFKQTFFDKSGKEITSHDNSFNLDGKESTKEEYGGINSESATWSPDKKILTTKSTRTVGKDVYGSTSTYFLSDNGLVMTVQTTDVNPLGMSVKQVFNKKQ